MSKSVLISIQPYWVFLIIANAMGWNIDKEKKAEVRKTFPKDEGWNEGVKIYCSKDKKSFAKIPKEYQPFMKPLLGKVVGEFVCDDIGEFKVFENGSVQYWNYHELGKTCLTYEELSNYIGKNKVGYGWNISDLKIYDKPKELSEFNHACPDNVKACKMCHHTIDGMRCNPITRPPQSWCYVEDMEGAK